VIEHGEVPVIVGSWVEQMVNLADRLAVIGRRR
jgi:hypothetical protein